VSVPSSELDPLPPLPQSSVSPPPEAKGGTTVIPTGKMVGGPNPDNWRKSLAFHVYSVFQPFGTDTLTDTDRPPSVDCGMSEAKTKI
jgi:hypothetical protein